MTDERLIELINLEIDEQLSPEQSDELKARVARDSEAARVREEMHNVSRELESISWIEPPDGFSQGILALLRRQETTESKEGPSAPFRAGRRYRVFRYGWAVAAGVVLGLLLAPLLFDEPWSSLYPTDATGAMREQISSDQWEIVDRRSIDGPPVEGRIEARRLGDRIAIELGLHSEDAGDVEIRYDANDLGLAGFSRSGESLGPLRIEEGTVTFGTTTGLRATLFLVDLRPEPSRLQIAIHSKDRKPLVETLRIDSGQERGADQKPTF